MKVKRFSATNNQEALMKVKSELGPDAVILYQRKVKARGVLGFFQKPIIEIVAATEENINKKKENISQDPKKLIRDLQQKVEEKKDFQGSDPSLIEDVNEIKKMLNLVIDSVNKQNLPQMIQGLQNEKASKLFYALQQQEIEEALIEEILQQYIAMENNQVMKSYGEDLIKKQVQKVISKYMTFEKDIQRAKYMFFVGPTGVGKTTTIAKLAAQFSLNEGKKVGLISADTYRIAAVEQLKTYSDILNIPLEVIYQPNDIHYAINKLQDREVIMIDTAGRSHKNQQQVKELKSLLNEVQDKETYLVMSCTSKNSDIKEIIKTYSFLDNYNIIFTKIDEATTFGTLLNTAKATKRPISYITTGQSVPEDIEETSTEKIASLLIKEAF